jgi:hypothetical protein
MVRRALSIAAAAMLFGVTACADRETVTDPEAAGNLTATADPIDSGDFLALTYNVHGAFEEVPGTIGDFVAAYREVIDRQRRISPLLNDYELAVVQENFVARLVLNFGFFKVRLLLVGPYTALERSALHQYRSGYQYPQAPPLPPPTDLDVSFSDGLVRFSQMHFAARDLLRESWGTCNGNDCFTRKGFSLARTQLPSIEPLTVDVYNLHMNAGDTENDFAARLDQARQLSEAIEEHSAGRAVIVAGDFNLNPFAANPEQAEHDRAILEELLQRNGLQDACTVLSCCDPNPGAPNACDATQVDRFLFRSSDFDQPQRVVLSPRSWVAKRRGTEFEGLSDHAAIVVRFAWQLFGTVGAP